MTRNVRARAGCGSVAFAVSGSWSGTGGRGRRDDDGVTLVEVVVAMALMAVVTALFTAGLLQVYRLTNAQEAMAQAGTQAHLAFSRLDREVRYASGINEPARVGGRWYVEYAVTNSGTAECSQLRLVASQQRLERRTWRGGDAPGPWTTVASGVAPVAAELPPFAVARAETAGRAHDELRITLAVHGGAGDAAVTERLAVAFAALNTAPAEERVAVCPGGLRA